MHPKRGRTISEEDLQVWEIENKKARHSRAFLVSGLLTFMVARCRNEAREFLPAGFFGRRIFASRYFCVTVFLRDRIFTVSN